MARRNSPRTGDGKAFYEAIVKKGWATKDFVLNSGISNGTVYNWFSQAELTEDQKQQIADALDVGVVEVFGDISTSEGGQPTGGTIEDESDLGEEKPRTAFSKERIEQILKDQERKPSVTLYDEFSLRLIGWTLWEAFLNERLEQLNVDIPEKVSWCRKYAAEYYAQRLLEAQQPGKDGS